MSDEDAFTRGVAALAAEHPEEAVTAFEELADQGVVDAAASYDRGLAYAMRARLGNSSGDLGHAVHGFEEARELTRDPVLSKNAADALVAVRTEIAHRRARAGEAVEFDRGISLERATGRLLPENVWATSSVVFAALFAAGLFVRWRASSARGRLRVAGFVTALVTAPLAVACLLGAYAARHERVALRDGIVVTDDARPADAKHLVIPGRGPLAEGARVLILDSSAGYTQIDLPEGPAWVPERAVLPLARP